MTAGSIDARPTFGATRRLLIVDDEETVRNILVLILRPAGFEIEVADDVSAAVRLLEKSSFDVVVTDKNLPDGSGLDVVRFLRERRMETGIVMVTGYGSHDSALEALELGVSDYLSKPFKDLSEIRTCVRSALERSLERRRVAELARSAVAPAADAERRLRFPVEFKVRFVFVDGTVSQAALCSSLSIVDLFIETAASIAPGTRVKLLLDLPDGMIGASGLVRRAIEGRVTRGIRVDFVDMDSSTETRVAACLEPARARLAERAPSAVENTEKVAQDFAAVADAAPPAIGADPEIDAIVQRWAASEPRAESLPESSAEPDEPARFDLDAFELFRSMAPEQVRLAGLMAESAEPHAPDEPPKKSLEQVDVRMLDERSLATEPAPSSEDAVATRLKERYGIDDGLFDVDEFQKKYGIDESIFADENEIEVEVPVVETSKPLPPWENRHATSHEQRSIFAQDLRRRAEDSISRGLLVQAASDLALAVVFDPADSELKKLHDEVRAKATAARADEAFREGLQQLALGNQDSAATLLLSACKARFEIRYVMTCSKVLLRIGTPQSLREARTLLRATVEREPKSAGLHLMLGLLAEGQGLPNIAVRIYRRVLELDPGNAEANARCLALEEE